MRPVTQQYLNAVRGSHTIAVRAKVLTTFQTSDSPGGVEIPILSGNVQSEARIFGQTEVQGALIVSSLDLTTDGRNTWPHNPTDLLAPFGNEIFIERGINLGTRGIEWVGLGYFRIDDVDQQSAPSGPIRISGSDRMANIEDARFTQPRQFLEGVTLGSIVEELITEVYPDAVIEWDDNTNLSTLGRTLVFEKERLDALTDLVTSVGKMMYWDHRGALVIRNVPDPTVPVYEVDSGPGGVLVELSRDLSRDGVYNGVVATGEAADTNPPVFAVAVDQGVNSPTLWGGRFGKVPRFYSSPFITTLSQAQSAAEAILVQSLGLPYNVDFTTSPNIALEALDAVLVRYPKYDRSIVTRSEVHVLQRISYPLLPEQAMTAVTREQRLATIGFIA
jgi:hypothetical protein